MDQSAIEYTDKTVAVTGASGYLACVVISALQKSRARTLRITRQDLLPIPGVETLKMDVRESECWKEIVSRADVIFHLAGNTSVYSAVKSPEESLNSTVLPVKLLVAAALAAGRKRRVVFASTATVYGLTDVLPVSEDMEPKPTTNYDLHKFTAERELELATKEGIIEGVSLRLSNVYGPSLGASSAKDRGILNKIIRMALQGDALRIFGDGNYVRDYIYIEDVARAFMAAGAGQGLMGRSFNIGSGKGATVRDVFHKVAERVEEITGRPVRIDNVPWPENADPIELRNFVADNTRFQNAAGWHPLTSLDRGIDLTIEYFSDH